MAITTSNPDGVRVTTAAKNGTLGSQAAAAANEIIFDTNINTNNGNLVGSPTFVGRLVMVRQGQSDEEVRYMTAVAGDNVTATVHEDWDVAPASGDTYHVCYLLKDAATVTGLSLINKRVADYSSTRRFSVGNSGGGGYAFFAILDGASLETVDNSSTTQADFTVEADGEYWQGYVASDQFVSAGYLIGTPAVNDELVFDSKSGGKTTFNNTFVTCVTQNSWELDGGTHNWFNSKWYSSVRPMYLAGTVSVSGCYIEGVGNSAELVRIEDTVSIDGLILVNTNGFDSLDDGLTEVLEIRSVTFVRNTRMIRVHDDKTWNVVDPVWSPSVTDQSDLSFEVDDLNEVNERFSALTTITDTSGSAIAGAFTCIVETTQAPNGGLPGVNRAITDSNGQTNNDIQKRNFTYATASTLNILTSGGFALRAYKYGKVPFILPITVTAPILQPITLPDDPAVVDASEHQALEDGVGIILERHATGETDPRAINVIHFDNGSGTAPTTGDTIAGAGGGSGTLIELLGNNVSGYLIIELRNATAYVNNEQLDNSPSGWTADADLSGGGSSLNEEFTWEVDCNSKTLADVYDYLAAKMATRRNPIIIEDDNGVFTNLTAEGQIGTARLMPSTPAVGDIVYFGNELSGFEQMLLDVGSGATGITGSVWEYWNGSWTALSGVTDNTSDFSTDGTVEFTFPTDWATTTINSVTAYFIRHRITAVSGPGGATLCEVEIDSIIREAIRWGEGEVSQLLFSGVNGFFTNRNVNLTEGVILTKRGAGTIDFFTADDGTTFTPPITYTLTATKIQSGTEARLFNEADESVLDSQETVEGSVVLAELAGGGSGYSASDVLTVSGGTFSTACQITVDTVDGGGAILTFTVTTPGSYSVNPTNPASVTGGGGSGATFNLTMEGTYTYNFTGGAIVARLYLFHVNYKEVNQEGIALDQNRDFVIQQRFDRDYQNP